jgi:hypothetical protein
MEKTNQETEFNVELYASKHSWVFLSSNLGPYTGGYLWSSVF